MRRQYERGAGPDSEDRPSGSSYYGRFDEAQMKLGVSRKKQLKENFYRKHDGTKCYYFSLEDVEKLFTSVGLQVLELEYLQRIYDNLKSGEKRRRVWVHGRFQKP